LTVLDLLEIKGRYIVIYDSGMWVVLTVTMHARFSSTIDLASLLLVCILFLFGSFGSD
jgi:hypothetical protein